MGVDVNIASFDMVIKCSKFDGKIYGLYYTSCETGSGRGKLLKYPVSIDVLTEWFKFGGKILRLTFSLKIS